MDTGDTIRHKTDRRIEIVACVHGHTAHLIGSEHRQVHVSEWEMVREATDAERMAHLRAMALSTGKGHRPDCARQRVARMDESHEWR
jgi:hypothetical protein